MIIASLYKDLIAREKPHLLWLVKNLHASRGRSQRDDEIKNKKRQKGDDTLKSSRKHSYKGKTSRASISKILNKAASPTTTTIANNNNKQQQTTNNNKQQTTPNNTKQLQITTSNKQQTTNNKQQTTNNNKQQQQQQTTTTTTNVFSEINKIKLQFYDMSKNVAISKKCRDISCRAQKAMSRQPWFGFVQTQVCGSNPFCRRAIGRDHTSNHTHTHTHTHSGNKQSKIRHINNTGNKQ